MKITEDEVFLISPKYAKKNNPKKIKTEEVTEKYMFSHLNIQGSG
jgi:hypothetical protein